MSLLLAKRASLKVTSGQDLKLLVSDKSSVEDMVRYFERHQWRTQLEHASDCYQLTIIKE
ncbi:hypothetical protein JCM19231_2155 [Vibrio ishigakensis]|uniref:Uncharacterized protein n=2 Tax=Vibrio ishigakensis TaxID=1481914 RepID=A0A0B8NZ04_9VIBR|nr:hypothetical protein JCM19231_2155 [Vibrio ishigakensis]